MELFSKKLTRKQFFAVVGLFLLLLLPNIALIIQFYTPVSDFAIFFMALAILLIPTLFLPLRVAFLIHGIFLLLLPIDISSWMGMGQALTEGFMNSIWYSNRAETLEQLRQYLLPVILFVVLLLFYFYLLFRVIPRKLWFARSLRLKILLPVVLVSFFLFSTFGNKFLRPFSTIATEGWTIKRYHASVKWTFNSTFPFDIVRRLFALQRHVSKLNALKSNRLVELGEDDVLYMGNQDSIIGVFVIGETSRACNWQLAGYDRETNPRLSKREHLYFFDDAFSGANYTRYSVPMLISRATPNDMYKWQNTPLITEVLAHAGYAQGWISSQSMEEVWLGLARQHCSYTFQSWDLESLDEKLLPPSRKFFDSVASDRQMLFMHTLGGHFAYVERYSKEFARFMPDLADKELGDNAFFNFRFGGKSVPGFVNSFDNTILYTDMVLDSVISMVESKRKPAFVIYMADHGENLLEPPEYRAYHSYDKPSHYEAHVPYLIWLSDEYLARYPQADSLLRARLHLPIQSTVTFHTLLDLTRVKYSLYDSTQSLLSPSFKPLDTRSIVNPDEKANPEPSYPADGVCPVYNRKARS